MDVNVHAKDGGIALRVAVSRDMELAKQLLEVKTVVNVQDEEGWIVLIKMGK